MSALSPNGLYLKDLAVRVKVLFTNFGDAHAGIAIYTRYQDIRNLYYIALSNYATESELGKRVSGTDTVLAETNFAASTNTVYTLEFRVYGNTLEYWRNNNLVISATDSSITSLGRIVIHAIEASGWIDDLIIRKYTYPEPTYSLGAEKIGFSLEIANKRISEYVSLVNVTYEIFSKVDSNVILEFYLNNDLVDTKEYFIQAGQTIYDHYIYTIEKEGNHTIKIVANFTTHNYVTEDSFAFNLTLYDYNVTYSNYTTYNNINTSIR
jgi:hypothetical protein